MVRRCFPNDILAKTQSLLFSLKRERDRARSILDGCTAQTMGNYELANKRDRDRVVRQNRPSDPLALFDWD